MTGMTDTHDPDTVLVTGASGKTGRRVAARLATAGYALRGASRATEPRLDWADPDTWPTVVVRSAFFAQGFTEDLLAGAVDAGLLRLPAGSTPEPFVDLDDLADVAVAGLTGRLADGVHELTGPRAITFTEAAEILTQASGHPVAYEAVTTAEFREDLLGLGLPAADADGLAGVFGEIFDGRNAAPTDGVRRALGREPRDLAVVMADAFAGAGAW
jgi:uncharacterized protein YbjT (DUF2867 family)